MTLIVILASTQVGAHGLTPISDVKVFNVADGVKRFEEYIPLGLDGAYYRVNVYSVKIGHGDFVLIDCGLEGVFNQLKAKILETLHRLPVAVLITHGHADHAGAGSRFIQLGIPVYAPQGDLWMILTGLNGLGLPPSFTYTAYQPTYILTPGQTYYGLLAVASPGHTAGSISFFNSHPGALFSADTTISRQNDKLEPEDMTFEVEFNTMLSQMISISDLWTQLQTLQSLKDMGSVAVFPGHGLAYYGRVPVMRFMVYCQQMVGYAISIKPPPLPLP